MKKLFGAAAYVLVFLVPAFPQCEVTASPAPNDLVCGDCAELWAFGQGQGQVVFSENFNSGAPSGWAFTQQARFDNPCSPQGVDGTIHIWLGNTSGVPRSLRTQPYNFSTATSGVTICFDLLMATQTGDPATAPCEGPDEPDEGVYLQYRVNGGPWVTIHYFDPNGGYDPRLTKWNNWCFQLPSAALTNNVEIQWFQDNDSGADYDHWGIDNVVIYFNDPTYVITWLHDSYSYGMGSSGGVNPTKVCPRTTTSYYVVMTNNVSTCRDTVTIPVTDPIVLVDAGRDTTICAGECATLSGTAKVIKEPARQKTFMNIQPEQVSNTFGTSTSVNINVQDLNMTAIQPNSIRQVCITELRYFGFNFNNIAGLDPNNPDFSRVFDDVSDLNVYLQCPDGTRVLLVPAGVTEPQRVNFQFPFPFNLIFPNVTAPDSIGYTGLCFVPAGADISTGAGTRYTGNFSPSEPFNNLTGCTANGLWSLVVSPGAGGLFGDGTLYGWSITFDDIEISYVGDFTWSPAVNMTGSNTLTPMVCPPSDQAYTLTLQDTAGCVMQSDSVTVIVDQNCCTLRFIATQSPPSCGAANGSITVTVISGSGNYSYLLNSNAATPPFSALSSGVYAVSVIDLTQGCQRDTAITLQPSNAPVIDAIIKTDETCLNAADGTASVSSSGGAGTITFTWSTNQTGSSVTGLPAGTHSVTAEDGIGCTAAGTFTIAPGPVCCSLQIVRVDTTSETCLGNNDGTASAVITGATGTAAFAWSGTPQTTPFVTGLAPGNHSVTVTDTNGCTGTATFTIDAGPSCCVLQVDSIITQPTCGQNDGAIALSITGSGNYTYLWSNNATSGSISGLFAGTYSVTVHDVTQNCDEVTIINLSNSSTNAPVITGTASVAETCRGDNDGAATVVASGGNGALSYAWSNSQATATITGLAPGAYFVTVSDTLGCQAIASVIVAVGPVCCRLQSSAAKTDAKCNTADGTIAITVVAASGTPPFSYSIDGVNYGASNTFTNLAAGSYEAIVRDADQCADTNTVIIIEADNTIALVMQSSNITCFGNNDGVAQVNISGGNPPHTVRWSNNSSSTTIINLSPGTYQVTVTDQANCQRIGSVSITQPAPVIASISGDLDICAGQSTVLSAGSFAQYRWSTGDTMPIITVSQSGTYSVTVYDAGGCPDDETVTVTVYPLPAADAGPDVTIYDYETITLSPIVSGTLNPSGFSWSPASGLSCSNCQNPAASPDSTVWYYLEYRDVRGCQAFDSVLITVLSGEFYAVVPNAFSPNGDNINDMLHVYHAGVKSLVLRVYNRWGSLIFQSRDPSTGWDGTFKGKRLDPGVFAYELYAQFFSPNVKPVKLKGSVMLLR